jgi:hypothetical protein
MVAAIAASHTIAADFALPDELCPREKAEELLPR